MKNDSPVALVTGSGKERIGNHIARELAAAGYRIVIHYHQSETPARQTVEQLGADGFEAIPLKADLTDEEEVRRLLADIFEAFGQLDVLVCSAAIWRPTPLEELGAKELRQHWETNSLSTFLCAKHAGQIMVAQQQGGCIITIGDWATARPYPNYAAYLASKGSIPTITRILAVELARRNPRVRVNCILPGPVMLPAELSEQEKEAVIAATLLKREGTSGHIAHAVRFLIENDFICEPKGTVQVKGKGPMTVWTLQTARPLN